MSTSLETLRIAAVADIHCSKTTQSSLQNLFAEAAERADMLLLCGDCTDTGMPEEAHLLARALTAVAKIPVVGVLGNHDYESGKQTEVAEILRDAGISILDGETCEVRGVGFAGVKGFAGGFGKYALQAWGEDAVKRFVQETVNEALRLESALSRLGRPQRVVLMHYSPIRETVEGESPDLFPFLGSSRMEEPLNRFEVAAVFHGHAHAGSPEGQTSRNIPVYNVSMPVLQRAYPDQPPFRLFELPVDQKGS